MAGKKRIVDDWISIVATCKYMGWTYQEYQNQPLPFLQTITMLRIGEAEEAERQQKYDK